MSRSILRWCEPAAHPRPVPKDPRERDRLAVREDEVDLGVGDAG